MANICAEKCGEFLVGDHQHLSSLVASALDYMAQKQKALYKLTFSVPLSLSVVFTLCAGKLEENYVSCRVCVCVFLYLMCVMCVCVFIVCGLFV